MAEVVGLVASILQLVDTVAEARNYVNDFRNARKDQKKLLLEIQNLQPLITELHQRLTSIQAAGMPSPVQRFKKPLHQLEETIKQLAKKLDPPSTARKVSIRLTWSLWGKDEVREGLNSIERSKSLLGVWLGMDIWDSTRGISSSVTDIANKVEHTVRSVEAVGRDQQKYHHHIILTATRTAEEQRINHNGLSKSLATIVQSQDQTLHSVEGVRQEQQKYHQHIISTVTHAAEEQRIGHNGLSKSIAAVVRGQDATDRETIMRWYSPLNFFLRQADVFSSHQPGTGAWFLEHEIFQEWRLKSGKILWCPGMPGAGKTVLASVVVHHLRSDPPGDNVGVAAIYLNHKENDEHSLSRLMAGLWRQLILGKSMSRTVQGLYAAHHEPGTRPSMDEDHHVLLSVVSEYSKVFLVVDALDEYPEERRDILLKYLLRLGPSVSVMLTSRPQITIGHCVSNFMTLEIRATADDIREYLDAQIQKSPRFCRHLKTTPDLQETIRREVIRRSDGMFLLSKLHIDSLMTKHTIKAVRDALRSMPADLEGTYDEAVERINRQCEDDRKLAWRTLSWITNAKRPLRLPELREALAVEPGDRELDPESLLDFETIASVCAGLVVLNVEDDTIRLIHFTIQSYLERIQARQFPGSESQIRLCRFCKAEIESPEHALLQCTASADLVLLRNDFLARMNNDIRRFPALNSMPALAFFTLMISYRHTISLVAKYAFGVTEIFESTPMLIPALPLHWMIQPQSTD